MDGHVRCCEPLDRGAVYTEHRHLGERWWYVDVGDYEEGALRGRPYSSPRTRRTRSGLFGVTQCQPYVKDGIHEAVVRGRMDKVNPEQVGTKVAAHFQAIVAPGETFTVRVRFSDAAHDHPFGDFEPVFEQRIHEADEFYAASSTQA